MCGITGFIANKVNWSICQQTLDSMTDALRHRGPDGRGTYCRQYESGDLVGLGHRRLSIIDIGGGKQPMCNEDGTVWVTFNGEIYNYNELRRSLQSQGHQFKTDSDTETLVHLYEQYGSNCVDHIQGMFAFAIWDEQQRQVFLARDRLGQKPLVYTNRDGLFAFSSELKSLLLIPGIPKNVNIKAIDSYLTYGYVPHPETILDGFCKLPPGHSAIWRNDELVVTRYWQPDYGRVDGRPIAEIREELTELLDRSVNLRLRSDVPVGASLSGGIDSTAIVGFMQRNLDFCAKSFTIRFPISTYDESSYARIAADHLKTDHHVFDVDADMVRELPTYLKFFDEPFADSSAIPTYYLSKFTRSQVTVALTGDGGDELFAGYGRYETVNRMSWVDRIPKMFRAIPTRMTSPFANDSSENSVIRRLKFRLGTLVGAHADRYFNWVAQFHDDRRHSIYSPDFLNRLGDYHPGSFVARPMELSRGRPAGTQAMHADLNTYLPCDLLTKVDMMSMAHGLECRSPFLDHKFVEAALGVPFATLTQGSYTKPFLNSIAGDLIPDSLKKRSKMGFRIPLSEWFRNELKEFAFDILMSSSALDRGFFKSSSIQALLNENSDGKWDHGDRIWSLLCLESWHQNYFDSNLSENDNSSDYGVTPVG